MIQKCQVAYPRPSSPSVGCHPLLVLEVRPMVSYLHLLKRVGFQHEVALRKEAQIDFDRQYTISPEPVDYWIKAYAFHASTLGIQPAAATALASVADNKGLLKIMATKTNTAAAPAPTGRGAPKEPAAAKQPKAGTAKEPKIAKAPKEPKAAKEPRRPSVSARICELIMEGKLTDDQIFGVLQKEFNLDQSKRSYITWNRSHLAKQGKNPPGPMGFDKKTPKVSPEQIAKKEAKVKEALKTVGKMEHEDPGTEPVKMGPKATLANQRGAKEAVEAAQIKRGKGKAVAAKASGAKASASKAAAVH